MKVLLTGASGDLGTLLSKELANQGDYSIKLDLRPPDSNEDLCQFIHGSVTDRHLLDSILPGIDSVVHIAAWHGIHEFRKDKDEYDFWDLNVTGTFLLLETCARAAVSRVVFISSTSVVDWPGIYAHSKLLAEDLMRTYAARHNMRIITLRPRAFIPHWNKSVYSNFAEWAQWFWKGAVHINDVSQAILQSLEVLQTSECRHLILTLDAACEFSKAELESWDKNGPGSTFRERFGEDSYKLFLKNGLDPTKKPKVLGYTEAAEKIGYKPEYGIGMLLKELAEHNRSDRTATDYF